MMVDYSKTMSQKPPRVFDNTDNLINEWLCSRAGIPLRNAGMDGVMCKSAVLKLREQELHLADLLDAIYRQILDNWRSPLAEEARSKSEGTWRWTLRPYPEVKNPPPHPSGKSLDERRAARPEVQLERTIAARLIAELGKSEAEKEWANQIPTSSGFSGPDSGGTQDIDLAHWRAHGEEVTLFELKVATSNPVAAAFQLVCYALLLVLAREEHARGSGQITVVDQRWLNAKQLSLIVLAPRSFYRSHDLHWFEQMFDESVARFCSAHGFHRTGFLFRAFPDPDVLTPWRPETAKELESYLDDANSANQPPWKPTP